LPFVESKTPRFLTKAEYERLLEASASNPRDFALIQLLLQTGIKLSELTRLTINDLELPSPSGLYSDESGYLHISGGERQKERILPLNYKACRALNEYLKTRTAAATSMLFVNRFGLPFRPRGVEKLVRKYLDASDIQNASVHTLRHTFGVHHAAKGTSVKTIGDTMGYKDHKSTLIYVSLAQELMRNELHDHAL
jgi:site-specific recombinase XerD